jgi:F-type H+-transporting ATPase subunit epsilon
MSEQTQQTLHVELITPQRAVLRCQDAVRVFLPSAAGEIGVLPGHTTLMAILDVGRIRVERPKVEEMLAVSGGLAEVHETGLRIVAETAEHAKDIDVDRAKAARERAEKRISAAAKDEGVDLPRAQAALARALNRIHVASAFHDSTVDNKD